jgi:Amt family ammonium transporter
VEEKKLITWSVRVVLVAILLLLTISVSVSADHDSLQTNADSLLWATALAWLVPVGLGLLACGAVPPERTASVIRVGWLALGISVVGYWLYGFAFQFGGLGFVVDRPGLTGLVREWTWTPLSETWGRQWGMLGLEGYMLRGPASTPEALALFLSQLPKITTAVAVSLWSLQGRAKPFALLIGNWTWGGGWLTNLGINLHLGHGFVDLFGAGAVHLAGAANALAGMLAFGARPFVHAQAGQVIQPSLPILNVTTTKDVKFAPSGQAYIPMPSLHLPVLATLGAWLAVIGWIGWGLSAPAYLVAGLNVNGVDMLIGLILAAAGGAMMSLAFSWLTTGEGNTLLTARGVLGAIVAISPGLPFLPFWAVLATGAAAGLLVPLVQFLVDHVLGLDDPTSAVATHGVSALWGLLAVGLFADGHAGQGWNRIGASTYRGINGQGVTGYLAATGYAVDWPGQFQAQVTGAAAIFLTAFLVSWLLYAAIQGLAHAWQGEYTIRLPRQPLHKRARPRSRGRRWPRIRFTRAPQKALHSTELSGKGDKLGIRSLFSAFKVWCRRIVQAVPRARPSPRQGQDKANADANQPGIETSMDSTEDQQEPSLG